MIEAASRSLRQQMANGVRTRPRSKGSLHDGTGREAGAWGAEALTSPEHRTAENAQRRIRSAENQHRTLSAHRDQPELSPGSGGGEAAVSSPDGQASLYGGCPASTSALDFSVVDDTSEDPQGAAAGTHPLEEAPPHFPQDFHPGELKRPLSRKKDPSASAAAGLGAFAGPARITDAFEQRKTRQPIPVESWGPRPPSRAGLPQKATPLEGVVDVDPKMISVPSRNGASSSLLVGRPASKASGDQALSPASLVVGGTWAAARAEPRVLSETRRGRDRKPSTASVPQVPYSNADLGVFGCGTRGPGQQLTKSLSGVFDHHNTPLAGNPRGNQLRRQPAGAAALSGAWAVDVASGALEVSGCGLGDAVTGSPGSWSGTGGSAPSAGGSPPTRKGGRHSLVVEAVSVEDVEGEQDSSPPANFRRDATPPQVIVTRSTQAGKGIRRTTGQERGAARERERNMPFPTSLDVDFLSLFAS